MWLDYPLCPRKFQKTVNDRPQSLEMLGRIPYDRIVQTDHRAFGKRPRVPERLLKTKQVADLLGLSDSTVKRLVNVGALHAVRTQGGHRLIPESEVRGYLRRRGGAVLAAVPDDEFSEPVYLNLLVEALLMALRSADEATTREVIFRAVASGFDGVRLADELIRPVMLAIGHAWERNELDVYEEHRATRTIEAVLIELIRNQPPPSPLAPLAMGAASEGDPYTIPGLLCELSLRQMGWDVINLGSNLPLPSLSRAVLAHEPKLLWLSVHWLADRPRFIAAYQTFFDEIAPTGTAVVLGGPALDADLRSELVAASFGDRMSHLREFARRLSPPPAGRSIATPDRLESNQP